MPKLDKHPVEGEYASAETIPTACCPECLKTPRIWQPLINQYYYDPMCNSEWAMIERIPFRSRKTRHPLSEWFTALANVTWLLFTIAALVSLITFVGHYAAVHHDTSRLWLLTSAAFVSWGATVVIVDHFIYTPFINGIEAAIRYVLNQSREVA
jgi:hypothetical protein